MKDIETFCHQWLNDKEFRGQVRANPALALEYAQVSVPPSCEIKLVEDTRQLMHVVMPPTGNKALEDDSLEHLSGGLIRKSYRSNALTHSLFYGGMAFNHRPFGGGFSLRPFSARD